MTLIKTNNIDFKFLNYFGKLWLLLLLMSVSVKMTAQIYVADKTVFTVEENTIIYSPTDVSLSKSKETPIVKIYVREGTQITNFPSDSLHAIVYLKVEKPSEKPPKEIVRKEKKTHKPLVVNTDDVKEKELFTVFKSKQNNSSSIFSSGNILKAIPVPSVSFAMKSISSVSRQEKKYYMLLFDVEQNAINSSNEDLKTAQHLLQEQITRPPPFSDYESHLRFLI